MGIAKWTIGAVAFAAVVAAERPCPAMTSSDLTGNSWDTSYSSRLRLPGLGSDRSSTSGDVSFSSDGTFAATEDDDGVTRNYTGTWRLSNRENKLKLKLDRAGRTELEDAIADWIGEVAADEGVSLSNLRVRLSRVGMKTARVPSSAGSFSTKLAATGQASARLGRRRLSAALGYASDVSVSPR